MDHPQRRNVITSMAGNKNKTKTKKKTKQQQTNKQTNKQKKGHVLKNLTKRWTQQI